MRITGKVVYVNLSGGFYGIETDNGKQYNPVNGLPKRFQQDGVQITATVSPADVMGIFMWGESVKLENISKA